MKFEIDINHQFAWHIVQELGYVLNYMSLGERLLNTMLHLTHTAERKALWTKHMNSHFSIFILLFFMATCANAQSLKSLSNILESKGTETLIGSLDAAKSADKGARYVELDDRLMLMGSDNVASPAPKWKVIDLKEGRGIQLNLKFGHYYFENNPTTVLELVSCPGGGATSGGAFKKFANGTTLEFSWSCGSIGCSYEAKFGEGYSPCS